MADDSAAALAGVITATYDENRYRPDATLWGYALHWDGAALRQDAGGKAPFRGILPHIIASADGSVVRPQDITALHVSYEAHYTELCLANQQVVEDAFLGMLSLPHGGRDGLAAMISGRALLEEALKTYVAAQGTQPRTWDFIEHLSRYDVAHRRLEPYAGAGTFAPLAGRLLHRFGPQDLEEKLFTHAGGPIAVEAFALHRASMEPVVLDAGLQALYRSVAGDAERYLAEEQAESRGHYGVRIPGLIRAPRRGSPGVVDWARYERQRRMQEASLRVADPNEVLAARAERALTERLLAKYKAGAPLDELLGQLSALESSSAGEALGVIGRVRKKFIILGEIPGLKTIHHQMPVISAEEQ